MALDEPLRLPKCDLVAAYLDDVILRGEIASFSEELGKFSDGAIRIGLVLNDSKCEIIGLSPIWEETGMNSSFKEPLLMDVCCSVHHCWTKVWIRVCVLISLYLKG